MHVQSCCFGYYAYCFFDVVVVMALTTFIRSDDGDGRENVKKAIGLIRQNNNFVRASHLFVDLFAVFTRLRRENA